MRTRRWLRVGAGLVGGLGLLFVVVVGPWPTASGDFETAAYYQGALAAIRESAARSSVSRAPGRLRAGWGQARLDLPPGTPLAGFSARKGEPSRGSHDELWIKAGAFGDGEDEAVLIGADLLLIPPEVAQAVRGQVEREMPLTADDLLFTASHTHAGPGSLAPGLAAEDSFGAYDPEVPQLLVEACVRAVEGAYRDLRPARLAHAESRAPDLVRNRTREGPVDDEISVLLLEQDGGRRCVGFDLPPLQWRPLSPRWRVSSVLTLALGLPSRGWMSMVRVGEVVFVAVPGDFSGEISARWKQWAAAQGHDLWCSSFSGAYAGCISPDAYYTEWADAKGRPAYETALMSWCGPRQEAFFTSLMRHMFEALVPSQARGAEVTTSGTRSST